MVTAHKQGRSCANNQRATVYVKTAAPAYRRQVAASQQSRGVKTTATGVRKALKYRNSLIRKHMANELRLGTVGAPRLFYAQQMMLWQRPRSPLPGDFVFKMTVGVFAVMVSLAGSTAQAQTRHFGFDGTGGQNTRAALINSIAARNSFLGSLSGVGTETFEGFSSGAFPSPLSFSGAGTATLTGSASVTTVGAGTDGNGRYPISGTNYVTSTTGQLTITFSEAIAAFGFFGVDIGDFSDAFQIQFLNGATVIDTWTPLADNCTNCNGSAAFFGTINTTQSYNRVIISGAGGGGDIFAFDDMTIGTLRQVSTVPEPGTYALVAVGLVASAMVRRRQRA